MWKHLHRGMLVLVAACCLILIPSLAMANELSCNSGAASGELFPTTGGGSACSNADDSDVGQHIFSWIICRYVQILNEVLGNLYCSLQNNLITPLGDVFTLYIVIFGVQILMGTTQLTVKEAMIRLLKIAGVWMFVSNATYGIGMAFDFFVSLAGEGTSWVLNGVMQSAPFQDQTNNPVLYNLGQTYTNSGGTMPIYAFLDLLMYKAVFGPITQANDTVTAFFVASGTLLPTIFALLAAYMWQNFVIVARALISFMLGISALAFLIALSPIFLSFMLFSITYHFFENWLKYMISFSLQIVIIFACIGMWLAVTSYFIGFFDNLMTVLPASYLLEQETASVTNIQKSVAICKYTYHDASPPQHYLPWVTPAANCSDPSDASGTIQLTNMAQEAALSQNPNQSFIRYLNVNLLTLLLITFGFSALLQQAPDIARQLAGPEYTPMIGQGFGFNSYGQMKGLAKPDRGESKKDSILGNVTGQGGSMVKDLVGQVTRMGSSRTNPVTKNDS